jgi:hypothetical protein
LYQIKLLFLEIVVVSSLESYPCQGHKCSLIKFQAPFVGSPLIHVYEKWVGLTDAHRLLDKKPEKRTVLWNSLISGYSL